MLRLIPALLLGLLLATADARAEGRDGVELSAGMTDLRAVTLDMLADLPDRKLKEIKRAPQRFVAVAADLIYGFGDAGVLGLDGLDRFVAFERARIRAREMRRLLLADLDDDGAVTRAEIGLLIAAEAASSRGRLELAFREADGAAGGVVDAVVEIAEMRAYAAAVARAEFDAEDVRLVRSILLFDLDGDGAVTLDEIIAGVEALAPQA